MHPSLVAPARGPAAIPLHAVAQKDAPAFLAADPARAGLKAAGFRGAEGELMPILAKDKVVGWVLGLGDSRDALALAAFAERLPEGLYRLGEVPEFCGHAHAALAWVLGTYRFDRFKTHAPRKARLIVPPRVDGEDISRIAAATIAGRDLINRPANDLGPADLADAARALARRFKGRARVVTGRALARDFPLIAAVGMGSARPPCLVDMTFGSPRHPKVTLVGKGICFDTGGYDLKPSSAMLTMKKDMGGAATALVVAQMVLGAKLPLRLRVLLPIAENSVSGHAMRPGDIFKSRKGLSIEVGNTDAEGRLVLADALDLADADAPDLLVDFATLTGAARAATGMDLPPFFTDDESLAAQLMQSGLAVHDPLWRLPLWRGYEPTLVSRVADLTNNPTYNLAGAITAALFLNRFVTRAKSWVHLDIPAWIDRPRPGRPLGGEPNGARAVYDLLKRRYAR